MFLHLRKAVKQAETDANKLNISLQNIWRHLVFYGFQADDLPTVSMGAGDEIFLVYRGSEIDAPTFIKIMEEDGYITKEDFIL
uniref:DUF3791 domain-containing protein n=1 Tax=Prevotella sp. GTC17254 TaxID=3236794 RepID=A0AB33J1I8_9BACT